MNPSHSPIGVCPRCEEPIPPGRTLIEYEAAGRTRAYAECPGCRAVVHPAGR